MKKVSFEQYNPIVVGVVVGFALAIPSIIRIQEIDISDDKMLYSIVATRAFLTIFSTVLYTLVFGFFGMIVLNLLHYGLNLWTQEHSYFTSVIVLAAALSILYPLLGFTYCPSLISSWSESYNDEVVVYPYYPVN